MKTSICFRMYVEKLDDVVPYPDQECSVLFYPNDELVINLGDDQPSYLYKLQKGSLTTIVPVPLWVDDLVEIALRLGHIEVMEHDSSINTKRWIVQAHANRNEGLCRCNQTGLLPGDFVQLWSGELLCYTQKHRLELVSKAWIPGYDNIPKQSSRPWEDDEENEE